MKTERRQEAVLEYFRNDSEKEIVFNESALSEAYERIAEKQSLPIKILTVFGGVMSSLSFIGFLFIAGLYDSSGGLLIFGGLFFIGALVLSREFDRIITHTVSISWYIMSYVLIGFAMDKLQANEDFLCLFFILMAVITLVVVQQYLLALAAVLVINGSLISLIFSHEVALGLPIYTAALTLAMMYWQLKEAKILTRHAIIARLYEPFKIGMILALLSCIFILSVKEVFPDFVQLVWISSAASILCILYVVYTLMEQWPATSNRARIGILFLLGLALLPTVFSPAISGSLLLILVCFRVHYQTGFTLGIVAFIYFIGQYYYDLEFTLLTKSLLLFSSGAVLIVLYSLIHKKLK